MSQKAYQLDCQKLAPKCFLPNSKWSDKHLYMSWSPNAPYDSPSLLVRHHNPITPLIGGYPH